MNLKGCFGHFTGVILHVGCGFKSVKTVKELMIVKKYNVNVTVHIINFFLIKNNLWITPEIKKHMVKSYVIFYLFD